MKLTQLQQYMVVAGAAILGVIFAYYSFLIKPLDADIESLRSELKTKQDKLAAAKETLAKYDEFKKRSAAVQRELEWAEGRIPDKLDRSAFVESINAAQSRSKVTMTSFKFRTGANANNKTGISELQAEIKFNSSYGELLDFCHEMMLAKNLTLIHEMKITPYIDPTGAEKTMAVQMVLGGLQEEKK